MAKMKKSPLGENTLWGGHFTQENVFIFGYILGYIFKKIHLAF
jgi:hypothetical protein